VSCPVNGVGRVQRVWEGDERGGGREERKEERERERGSERESEAGAEARTGVYR